MNDKFISDGNTFTFPSCNNCKHYFRDKPGATCAAFPDGIPDAILTGENDHRKPYPGDHGIRFEPIGEGKP